MMITGRRSVNDHRLLGVAVAESTCETTEMIVNGTSGEYALAENSEQRKAYPTPLAKTFEINPEPPVSIANLHDRGE